MTLYQICYIINNKRVIPPVCFLTENAAIEYVKKEYANCNIEFSVSIGDTTLINIYTQKDKYLNAYIEPLIILC